jgi:hypothetical protein
VIRLWKFVKSLFAWRRVFSSGVWIYFENKIAGDREAVATFNGWCAVDLVWLRSGRGAAYIYGVHDRQCIKEGPL